MADIEFGTPPPQGAIEWAPIAEALRDRPGEWAKVVTREDPDRARQTAAYIRSGRGTAFRPPGAFECRSRDRDVWARYIGDDAQ